MLILDTDILTIIQIRQGGLYEKTVEGISTFGNDVAYHRLSELLADFIVRSVLRYEAGAGQVFELLRTKHRRSGVMDLKIAAIALSHDATLATRNTTDFQAIEGLRVVDPTVVR